MLFWMLLHRCLRFFSELLGHYKIYSVRKHSKYFNNTVKLIKLFFIIDSKKAFCSNILIRIWVFLNGWGNNKKTFLRNLDISCIY